MSQGINIKYGTLDEMSPVAYSKPIMFKFPIDSFRDRVSVLPDLYASTDDQVLTIIHEVQVNK